MARQLRVDTIPETAYYKERDEERARPGRPKDFDQQLPRAKIALLAGTGAETAVIGNFLRLADRANYVSSVEGSLRFAASGINSYASF